MSETLNNTAENVGSDSNFATAMENAPKFDPEAAQVKVDEYKANHPDAVEDVEKARAMANAENPYMEQAIGIRDAARDIANGDRPQNKEAEKAIESVYENREHYSGDAAPTEQEQKLAAAKEALRHKMVQADNVGRRAGESYDYKKSVDNDMNRMLNR